MIHIVTGPIDSGKTSRLQAIHQASPQGDGFLSLKVMDGEGVLGYDLLRLSTGQRQPFIRRTAACPPAWDELWRLGPFSFSRQGRLFAESIIIDLLQRRVEPVFMDEIGPLELQGKGFCPLVRQLVESELTVYMAVRRECLADVIRFFAIAEHRLLPVTADPA
jgi:nucleoside-triphosphatase THEP1